VSSSTARRRMRSASSPPSPAASRGASSTAHNRDWRRSCANLADEIAYNAHDIDDGVRSGLITLEQVAEVDLFRVFQRETLAEFPQLQGRRLLYESIRRMLSAQVYDVIAATQQALAIAVPANVQAVSRGRPAGHVQRRDARSAPRRSSSSCCATCTAIRR